MNSKLGSSIVIGFILTILIGGLLYSMQISQQPSGFTLEEISLHDSPKDCWMAIEGKVYDITQYITDRQHPGGGTILNGCGKDATELFNKRPSSDNTPHSEKARSLLPPFYIGDLVQ
jgi:cytochrome b involved in lipid metabolism